MGGGGSRYGGYGMGMYVNPEQFASGWNMAGTIGSALNIENAEAAQQENQQLAPLRMQEAQNASEMSRYQLMGEKMNSDLAHNSYENAMIADTARKAEIADDPATAWDQGFQALKDKGIDQAGQFIGRYSPSMVERVNQGYDETSSLARGTRAPASSREQSSPEDYARYFANVPPEKMEQIADTTGRALELLSGVHDEQSWEQAKAAAVKAGMPAAAKLGPYNNGLPAQSLYQHFLGIHNYVTQRIMDQSTGLPAPLVTGKTQVMGDTIYGINEETPSGMPTATPIAHVPTNTIVGYDKFGHAVYGDTRAVPGMGPQERTGTFAVTTPRYGGTGAAAIAAKQNGWLAIHPGDMAGATAFAGGIKQMSPQEISQAADKMAETDYGRLVQNAGMGGPPAPDMNTFLNTQRAMYMNQLSQQNAPQGGQPGNPRGGQRYDQAASINSARAAIKRGAPRAAVIARLKAAGISTAGL